MSEINLKQRAMNNPKNNLGEFKLEGFGLEVAEKPLTIVVGMSGGVDSSVTAAILKAQGHNVIGLFMKNWEEVDDCGVCTATADFEDVRRVCERIGIPYYGVNFSKQYYDNVFEDFLSGLKRGITPNPDILCNREIKYGYLLEKALSLGADYLATGHYAGVEKIGDKFVLKKAKDLSKDQSYFLCALSQTQLSRAMFPLENLLKTEVREIAKKLGLTTAEKKDSTGICFIGEKRMREFLKNYIGGKPGDIKTADGKIVGKHEGLAFYTLGQRRGLNIGGVSENTSRWFVVKKDLDNNVLVVSNGECEEMFRDSLTCAEFNWVDESAKSLAIPNDAKKLTNAEGLGGATEFNITAKTRYRQPDQAARFEILENGDLKVFFAEKQRAITAGQWCVLYNGEKVIGGGIIL